MLLADHDRVRHAKLLPERVGRNAREVGQKRAEHPPVADAGPHATGIVFTDTCHRQSESNGGMRGRFLPEYDFVGSSVPSPVL